MQELAIKLYDDLLEHVLEELNWKKGPSPHSAYFSLITHRDDPLYYYAPGNMVGTFRQLGYRQGQRGYKLPNSVAEFLCGVDSLSALVCLRGTCIAEPAAGLQIRKVGMIGVELHKIHLLPLNNNCIEHVATKVQEDILKRHHSWKPMVKSEVYSLYNSVFEDPPADFVNALNDWDSYVYESSPDIDSDLLYLSDYSMESP